MGDGVGATADQGIGTEGLARALRAADPAAVLVAPRILRRVIKHDRKLTNLGLQVPHRKTYAVAAGSALEIVDRAELGLLPGENLPETLLLLERPDPERLEGRPAGEVLRDYWRLLYHARLDAELEARYRSGTLGPERVRERIDRIGQVAFDEARAVLRYEDYLLPPRDDATVYQEFAAVYLELKHFAPALLPYYFSAIGDHAAVDEVLAEDVDGDRILAACRPEGAADPAPAHEPTAEADGHADPEDLVETVGAIVEGDDEAEAAERSAPSEAAYRALMRRADAAVERGNLVRGAILRCWAARVASPTAARRARSAARIDLERLADRLRPALGVGTTEADRWRKALGPLLAPASRGGWTTEARLLYDLQKACVDHERPIYTVDLVEWFLSAFRRPVRRLLPHQREVLMAKHLRSARRRLRVAKLADADRERLAGLLREAVRRAEEALRDRCRGPITAALERTGLRPRDVPERVAARKLVEELLDRVVDRGYLNMGHLRDAIARNNLKLPDLAGPIEFARGDRLLRADRALSEALDGIYHRGELYLRLLQRFSSMAFGTRLGRFVTRYVALPFGGAFVIVKGLDHLIGDLLKWASGRGRAEGVVRAALEAEGAVSTAGALADGSPAIGAEAATMAAHEANVRFYEPHLIPEAQFPWVVAVVGVLILGLLYAPRFRRLVVEGIKAVYRAIRGALVDLPAWIFSRRLVRRVLDSATFVLIWSVVLKPLAYAGATFATLRVLVDLRSDEAAVGAAATFLVVGLTLNSRAGRDAEEIAADWLVSTWRRVRLNLIPGLIRAIIEAFDELLEAVDRLLYAVDEWLRFRGGDGRATMGVKAVLGVAWFVVTYVVRFVINLLVEPQLNPIKHFPVVTVSHKVLAPFLLMLIPLLTPTLGRETAGTIWFLTQLLLPGVFGFLVWELKENWRLYEANRPRMLGPVAIGSHGETMLRLMRPGFHSGTLPKLYARLRRAERLAERRGGDRRGVRKLHEGLHHVDVELRRFADRELVELLRQARAAGIAAPDVTAGAVELAANRVRIELRRGPGPGLWLAFDEQSGRVVAGLAETGWLDRLSTAERRSLDAALAGLYKLAGVELVRERLAEELAPAPGAPCPPYDVNDRGLVVWPGPGYGVEVVYDLRPEPRPTADGSPPPPPAGPQFGAAALPWPLWVETWSGDGPPARPLPEPLRVLTEAPEVAGAATAGARIRAAHERAPGA